MKDAFKIPLISITTSLAACAAFHDPAILLLYLWFGIGLLVGLAGNKTNNGYYEISFIISSIFFWPITLFVLWLESDLLEAMLNIIPGYTISINKDEE